MLKDIEVKKIAPAQLPDPFDGRLASCLSDAGRKADRDRNMSGYVTGTDTKYVFYLGYLMGTGKIKEEAEA